MNSAPEAWAIVKDSEPVMPFVHKQGGYGDYLAAFYAAQMDDSVTASSLYNNVMKNQPGNTDLRQRAFYHSVIAGNPAAFVWARQERGDSISALVLANDAIIRGNWQEALKYLSNPPNDPFGQVTYLLLQAWCLYGNHQADQAYALLEKGVNTPIASVFLIHYGIMEYLNHHDQRAGALFERANQDSPGADLLLTQAYGHWLFQNHRTGKAEAMVDSLVDSLPFLSIVKSGLHKHLSEFPVKDVRQGIAQVYLAMAGVIQQELFTQPNGNDGDMNAKVSYKVAQHTEQIFLRFALQLNPDLSEAKIMLSGVLADQGNLQSARSVLFPVSPSDPFKAGVQFQAARVDAMLNAYSRSEQEIRELIASFPHEISLWQTLGDIYFEQKKYKQTLIAYDKVVELKKNKFRQDWLVFFTRGIAYEKQKQWPRAQKDFQNALILAPNEPMLLNYVGYSWALRKENLQEAQKMLQKAVDIAPDEGAIRDSLGWVMVLNHQIPQAIRQLEMASEVIPQDPELNYHLGVAYWRAGRYLEGVNQWNVALTCSPDSKTRQLIIQSLQEARKNRDLYP